MTNKAQHEDICSGWTQQESWWENEESDGGEEIKTVQSRSWKGRFAHCQNSFVKQLPLLFWTMEEELLLELPVSTHTEWNEMGGLFSSLDFWGEATLPAVSPVTVPRGHDQTHRDGGNVPQSPNSMLIRNSLKSIYGRLEVRDVNSWISCQTRLQFQLHLLYVKVHF